MATCTRPAALTAISAVVCGINLGQIVAAVFQRQQDDAPFATEAAAKVLANWTALLTAADDTKMVKTPEFPGFKIPSSEPQYINENSNESIDGLGTFVGFNSVKATAVFESLPFEIAEEIRTLADESTAGLTQGLTGFLITGDRRILARKLADGKIAGIDLYNFYLASRGLEGLKTTDKLPFGFSLAPDWDKDLVLITPSFDPRKALNPA